MGEFLRQYGYPHSPVDVVHAVLAAGVDTDCGGSGTPNWSNDTLLELLQNKTTSTVVTPLIDASLTRLFTVRMRLGHFDAASSQPSWSEYGLDEVDTPAHRDLALDAALQGFVLLKNEHQVLPLRKLPAGAGAGADAGGKLAVLGPNSNSGASWQLGNYHERQVPSGVLLSPCDGIKAMFGGSDSSSVNCATAANCSIGGNASDSTCFDAASNSAIETADVVLLFVGLDGSQEAEGHDKTSLLLPGTQLSMVDSVTQAAARADKPVVTVYVSPFNHE